MPRGTPQQFTKRQVEQLAQNPNVTVYQEEFDHFEPWPVDRVEACATRLVALTVEGTTDYRAAVEQDAELREFSERYSHTFSKLIDPTFVRDPTNLNKYFAMLRLREQVEKGLVSPADADRQAVSITFGQ